MFFETFLNSVNSGVGSNLIWARMDIFRDSDFEERFNSPPVLKTTEKLHVGLEVIFRKLFARRLLYNLNNSKRLSVFKIANNDS